MSNACLPNGWKLGRELYVLSYALLGIDELKAEGLLAGGPSIDRDALHAIVQAGAVAGFDEPCQDEIDEILGLLVEALDGDPEEPVEVSIEIPFNHDVF